MKNMKITMKEIEKRFGQIMINEAIKPDQGCVAKFLSEEPYPKVLLDEEVRKSRL